MKGGYEFSEATKHDIIKEETTCQSTVSKRARPSALWLL